MKLLKYILPTLLVAGCLPQTVQAQLIGQETRFDRELRTRDDQAVSAFIDSKENIPVKDKAKNLEISGDVRFEYTKRFEKGVVIYQPKASSSSSSSSLPSFTGSSESSLEPDFVENYRSLRGGNYVDSRGVPISHNDFDVEFNLKLKYTFDHAWANAQLQFDNPCGIRGRNDCVTRYIVLNKKGTEVESSLPVDAKRCYKGSGEGAAINLKRAFIGYNFYADGHDRFDIEVGRRKFSDVFDSELQFTARFDGILLKYATVIPSVSDFYWNTAGFVIDENRSHFGWITEFGFLNIRDTGLDLKYSFIDWRKEGRNRCFERHPIGMEFANSQITLAYNFEPEIYCHKLPAQFYGGFLFNHAAHKSKFCRRKENLGAYAGFTIGEVNKKGDWSIDIEYIYIQAQAVADFDVGSIGRGNLLNECFVDIVEADVFSSGSDSFSSGSSSSDNRYYARRGNANFKGLRIDSLYAITDNLSIEMIYQFSREINRKLGGRHKYSDLEIEVIYAF